ncbi:MAG TPA: hypothetical protein VFM68_02690 [Candidatus Saccharimonadales bacterium]|nr:hypothetical protein [Candidatus Saccharimonadales bacterium]
METTQKKKSGLATAGLVLGIIGAVLAFIPIVNIVSFVLGALALIFGGIALAKKASKGKAIAAVILGIASIVIAAMMLTALGQAVDEATSPTETSNSSESTTDNTESTETTFDGTAVFDKITNGMTKEEVRDVAGVDPESCTESQDPTFGTIETCSYGNMFKDDVTVSVTYSQGEVSNKSKFTN